MNNPNYYKDEVVHIHCLCFNHAKTTVLNRFQLNFRQKLPIYLGVS